MLRIIHSCAPGEHRYADQKIGKRIPGYRRERRKSEEPSRLYIAKRILLKDAEVYTELGQMAPL